MSYKAVGEGLEFWLEAPTVRIASGNSIQVFMVISNQLDVSRPFYHRKGRYHDTSIGDFQVLDSVTGQTIESAVPFADRIFSSGDKGVVMKPHELVRAEGYLERTFNLTNAGKYLISARGRFESTNWTGQPTGGPIYLQTPPVEIEILPSTNVSSVKHKLAMEAAPAAIAVTSEPKKTSATISPSETPAPGAETRQATAVDQPPLSSKRNRVYILILGGICLFAFAWLLVRRKVA